MTVSIITATYNAGKTFESALRSVINQTHPHIEYIVVDGGSSDQTLKIADTYKAFIHHFISEPDRGIYDALNKGIEMATGDVIAFLHADDLLDDDTTIATIVEEFERTKADAIYGDLEYVQFQNPDKVIRYWQSKTFKPALLKAGWMPPHPTLFLKAQVFKEIGKFNIDYKIAADYDFILRFFSNGKYVAEYVPMVITRMRVGGTSNNSLKNIWIKSKEDLRALKQNKVGNVLSLIWKNVSKLPQFLKRN
ncbi:glycosyltransferase [Saccharicrinis carchari]|uniref:Glycosyltransferase n=1 Tax=Saccharicrinis carchari TaxID=1168039 RepID=A0A521AVY2_SACCC|nr:glycosyltransferase family 2 protein [Saccharicrinis carchari]SMO39003.1 glycosyltransferase [Saccharicrinis carchari]